jgi:ankyrin repeat protein
MNAYGNNIKQGVLIWAVQSWSSDVVKKLIDSGANVNETNSNGDTPLYLWCKFGRPLDDACRLLIKRGADLNIKNKMGETPMSAAIKNGRLDLVRVLITYSAYYRTACDSSGRTPEQLARHLNQNEIANFLGTLPINLIGE